MSGKRIKIIRKLFPIIATRAQWRWIKRNHKRLIKEFNLK